MEGISTTYIISQVFVIIMYTLVSLTYYVSAYTGLAMCFVALIRNAIFLVDEKKNGKTEIISKKDIAILLILFSITIISSIFTYDGIFSLLSVFATMLYTYSMWQKKTITYKILRDTSRYFMDII